MEPMVVDEEGMSWAIVPGDRGPRWRTLVLVGLGVLQWVILGLDLAIPSVAVYSYLSLPVLASAVLARPAWTGVLAGQAAFLGLISAALLGYFDTPQGWTRWLLLLAVSLAGWLVSWVLAQRDEALERAASAESRFRLLTLATSDVVLEVGADGVIAWASPSVQTALGFTPDEVAGTRVVGLLHPADVRSLRSDAQEARDLPNRGALRMHRKDGGYRWMDVQGDRLPGDSGSQVIRLRNAEEHVEHVRGLEQQANTDPLTGLFNRREAMRRLQAFASRRRNGTGTALLFIDVDRLKEINDTHGHEAGDIVLTTLAGRMKEQIRTTDVAARMGGDEFVVGLTGVDTVVDAAGVADKIRQACAAPISLTDGSTAVSTVSIGVGLQVGGEDLADVLKRADQALYAAKEAGRDRVVTATEKSATG